MTNESTGLDTARYGVVTAVYFFVFMYRYNQGLILTDRRAMINVVWVFMLSQPMCRFVTFLLIVDIG